MTADEAVAFAEELARIAAAGGGPAALAACLARRSKMAVVVEDAQHHRLAAAGAPEGKTAAAQSRIGPQESPLGHLCVFGRSPEFITLLLRLTASVLAVQLAHDAAAQPGRRRTFWERLCTSAYTDAASARDDAAARGIAIASHYVAIALEAEVRDDANAAADQEAFRSYAIDAFRGGGADVGLLERGNTLLFFLPAPREVDAANARTAASLFPRGLAKQHPELRAAGGVGTRVALTETKRSVAQAQAALTIARRLHGPGRIGVYDDLGVYPLLLEGSDPQALGHFAQRTLAPLRAYDEKHQTELERTLHVYFECGENVKTAAAELFVHRHTVFYRLRQIGDICACKLDDPHDQLTLRMAMAIDALTK
jgi:sugar diacid utilization regulator